MIKWLTRWLIKHWSRDKFRPGNTSDYILNMLMAITSGKVVLATYNNNNNNNNNNNVTSTPSPRSRRSSGVTSSSSRTMGKLRPDSYFGCPARSSYRKNFP